MIHESWCSQFVSESPEFLPCAGVGGVGEGEESGCEAAGVDVGCEEGEGEGLDGWELGGYC